MATTWKTQSTQKNLSSKARFLFQAELENGSINLSGNRYMSSSISVFIYSWLGFISSSYEY